MLILNDKKPSVTRITNIGIVESDYEYYNVYTDNSEIEELTLEDIIFLRDRFSTFIEDAKIKLKKEVPNG